MMRAIVDALDKLDEQTLRVLARDLSSPLTFPSVNINKKIHCVDLDLRRYAETPLELLPGEVRTCLSEMLKVTNSDDAKNEIQAHAGKKDIAADETVPFMIDGFKTILKERKDEEDIAKLVNKIILLEFIIEKMDTDKIVEDFQVLVALHGQLSFAKGALVDVYNDKFNKNHDGMLQIKDEEAVDTQPLFAADAIEVERKKIIIDYYLQYLWNEIHKSEGFDHSKIGENPYYEPILFVREGSVHYPLVNQYNIVLQLKNDLDNTKLSPNERLSVFDNHLKIARPTLAENHNDITLKFVELLEKVTFGHLKFFKENEKLVRKLEETPSQQKKVLIRKVTH